MQSLVKLSCIVQTLQVPQFFSVSARHPAEGKEWEENNERPMTETRAKLRSLCPDVNRLAVWLSSVKNRLYGEGEVVDIMSLSPACMTL